MWSSSLHIHVGTWPWGQPGHRMHLLHLDRGRQPGHQEYIFCLPGKLGRQPIAIFASSTALFRAENLSPVCLPLTSSLNRLNKARPAGVPLHTVVQHSSTGNATRPSSSYNPSVSYLPTDCHTAGAAGASAISLCCYCIPTDNMALMIAASIRLLGLPWATSCFPVPVVPFNLPSY